MARERQDRTRMTGTREDPHAQARAARGLPLLVHSMSAFRELFETIARSREIRVVVEVGVESGQVSSLYADLGATVHCVEPDPDEDLRAVLAADPRLNLVEGRSPDVLGDLPAADLYVLDGDHNYAVVRAELAWIMENAPDAVVVLHDVLWPCGRRDFYYQPSPLPPGDTHPDAPEDGPTVWHDDLTPAGFVGGGAFTAARHAGGERNGVLTAIEDALAEADGGGWRFEIVPAVFGFGVLARTDVPGTVGMFEALRPHTSSGLLATLENNRIALYTRVLQLQYEALARAEDANRLAETVRAQQEEIERLRADRADGTRDEPARSPAVTGFIESVAMHDERWGTFLEPDPGLPGVENPHDVLGIQILGGHHADLGAFAGRNAVFDRIAARTEGVGLAYEDQCSAQHYFDVFCCVEREHRELTRVVDVGVFMGGSSAVLAGCVEPMGLELDLVDANPAYLQFARERVRRIFPGAMPRVRMFFGDLPTYVRTVLLAEEGTRALVHHDGAHDFPQVVKDLSSLYFARDRVHGVALQDTHLRGNIEHCNFVDAAVHAMFGVDVKYEPLGARYPAGTPVTRPNQWDGNYFLADTPEGMYIPFDSVEWGYPHPTMKIEAFLPVKAAPAR
ncbi:class I SAM-dependent methyltransferase [Actinomadura graeca]|uniref:Class I SAM-dependent methyltransferase n=1 Tax=Actinomadura graeca TaxID=2750812 RepID=A0ABX8QZC4_9ACTN|nr:class I SAM-dependent methyltransferase [Actinomadura graeca]QXJ23973.1 class I SAM-dependent methyltransferase [Actinomadura graeca]